MWGNLKGWIIAGVMLLMLGLTVFYVNGVNQISQPTSWGKDPKKLAPLKFDVEPSTIVPMSTPGDAAALYASAIDDVKRSAPRYERFLESTVAKEGEDLAAVKAALQAASMTPGPLLAGEPRENIGYFEDNASDDLKALKRTGDCLGRIAALHNSQKKTAEATKYYEALFALGAKMFAERLVFQEAFFGIGMMREATSGLVRMADAEKQTDRAKALRDFDAAAAAVYAQMQPMWTIVYGVEPKATARHAGDFYYFTSPAQKEKMWRVEAILKVGRLKFNAGGACARLANQANVTPTLTELQASKDPVIKAAADAAQELTLDDFRKIQ